jgi:phage gpG-like protein
MLTVRLRGLEPVLAKYAGLRERLHAALLRTVEVETKLLQQHVVEDKLSGQVLRVRTGTLRRSITETVQDAPGVITGRVGTNLGYGLAHEFGATIQIPEIVPRRAKALHWMSGGQSVFAMRARAHPVRLPERSFLRSALADRRDAFIAAVRATLARVLQPPAEEKK